MTAAAKPPQSGALIYSSDFISNLLPGHDPNLRAALVAYKIQYAVRDDRRDHQKPGQVTRPPLLVKIPNYQIDHKGLLERAERHGFKPQPGTKNSDYHQRP